MTLITLVSPGNAPGVTTTGLALTLAWDQPVLLAECSPDGGTLLAGYFGGRIPADRGLWQLALTARHGVQAAAQDLPNQVVSLGEQRLLLPGLRDPFRSVQLTEEMWDHITQVVTHLPMDVIADIGHVGADLPFGLVRAADLVVMVLRPTLAQAAAAKPRLEALRDALGDLVPLGLCLVGDGRYEARDVQRTLGDFMVTVQVPEDHRSAQVLSDGDIPRRGFDSHPLMRESSAIVRMLRRLIEASPAGSPAVPLGGAA